MTRIGFDLAYFIRNAWRFGHARFREMISALRLRIADRAARR
jgi:hypothetical protein